MDTTLSHLVESLRGTQGAAVAVALSVGLLLLTAVQLASGPQKSVPARLPLKIEAVGFQGPEWTKSPPTHQQTCLAIRRAC